MSNFSGTVEIVDSNAETTETFAVTAFLEILNGRIFGLLAGADFAEGIVMDFFIDGDFVPGQAGTTGTLEGNLSSFTLSNQAEDYYEFSSDSQSTRLITGATPTPITLSSFSFTKNPAPGANVTVSISLTATIQESTEGVTGSENISPLTSTLRTESTPHRLNEMGSSFDNFGIFSGIERLSEERNFYFNERIKDAIERPGSPRVEGIILAATRDLGLEREVGIKLKLHSRIQEALDSKLYKNSRIIIEGGRVKVYLQWLSGRPASGEPSWKKATDVNGQDFDFDLESLTLGQLVDKLNQVKVEVIGPPAKSYQLYDAKLIADKNWPARGLLSFDSRLFVQESLRLTERTLLSYTNIIQDSFSVERNSFLKRERPSEASVEALGDYHLDFDTGLLTVKGRTEGRLRFSYIVHLNESELEVAPVQLLDLQSSAAQENFFTQIEQKFYETEDEKTINGLPTNEMFKILREILTAGVIPQRWAE